MKRPFRAGLLALPLLLLAAPPASAHFPWGGYSSLYSSCCHGYDWSFDRGGGCLCLNMFGGIHRHGPLYNYGPIYPGYGHGYDGWGGWGKGCGLFGCLRGRFGCGGLGLGGCGLGGWGCGRAWGCGGFGGCGLKGLFHKLCFWKRGCDGCEIAGGDCAGCAPGAAPVPAGAGTATAAAGTVAAVPPGAGFANLNYSALTPAGFAVVGDAR